MGFDSNTKAVLLCENNFNDSSGNGYNFTNNGTPGFSTAEKYEGSYSKYDNRQGGATSPAELNTLLSSAGQITIEWYCKVTDHGGAQDNMIWVTGTNYAWPVLYTNTSGCGANSLVLFSRNGASCCGDYTSYYDSWVRHNLEWDGTNWKYYVDGVLVATRAENVNPFSSGGVISITPANERSVAYYDRIIISDTLRGGAKTEALPDITSCTPDNGSTAGGTAVTIAGANFTGATGVTFGGDAATSVSVVSDTEITCVTPAHAAGAVDIVVTTSAGTGTLTNGFTYINPAPVITSIDPESGLIFGGTTTTITGTGFTTTTGVTFGGLNAASYTVDSSTTITAITPPHAAGLVDVVIQTAYGTATLSGGFAYTAPELYTPSKNYKIVANGIDITSFQQTKYTDRRELNILENYDYAFDGVSVNLPLEFKDKIPPSSKLEVYNLQNKKVYIGKLLSRKFKLQQNTMLIDSVPLTDNFSKLADIYSLRAANPCSHIEKLINTDIPSGYSMANIAAQGQKLPGINVSLSTDEKAANVKSLLNSLCTDYDIGLYNDGLAICAFSLPDNFPAVTDDITEYLIKKPDIEEVTDYLYNKVILTYSTAPGEDEAVVTAGNGTLTLLHTLSSTYCTEQVAKLIAARKLAIHNKVYYRLEGSVTANFMFKLSNYFSYAGYTFIITGIEQAAAHINIKALGVAE